MVRNCLRSYKLDRIVLWNLVVEWTECNFKKILFDDDVMQVVTVSRLNGVVEIPLNSNAREL